MHVSRWGWGGVLCGPYIDHHCSGICGTRWGGKLFRSKVEDLPEEEAEPPSSSAKTPKTLSPSLWSGSYLEGVNLPPRIFDLAALHCPRQNKP